MIEISEDQRSAVISGRELVSLSKKLNPIWWWFNDSEQQLEEAPWYQPSWPQWRRKLYWYVFRNPLQNCRAFCAWYAFVMVAVFWLIVFPPALPLALFFIGGVCDRNYDVVGRAPVLTIQRNDLVPPEHGWQWCVITLRSGIKLPFVSYSGQRFVGYIGWNPFGFFGMKLNLHKE